MSEIADQIAALQEAMASGALEIETRTNGVYKRVKYQSYADMRRALSDLLARQTLESGRKLPRVGLSAAGRGLR